MTRDAMIEKLSDALEDMDVSSNAYDQVSTVLAALAAPVAAEPPSLVALVQEWQEARKPATLSAPGEFLAETFQAAVRRMSAADEALAGYRLDEAHPARPTETQT